MERNDHAGVWVPPPVLFALPLAAAAMAHGKSPWLLYDGDVTALTVIAVVVLAAGVAIGVASVRSFRTAQTTILPAGKPTTSIVERGPYRFTRNPMYLAMAIAYVGLALLLNSVWAVVMLPCIIGVIDVFVIRREERYLAAKFGTPYREYCAMVRRWI